MDLKTVKLPNVRSGTCTVYATSTKVWKVCHRLGWLRWVAGMKKGLCKQNPEDKRGIPNEDGRKEREDRERAKKKRGTSKPSCRVNPEQRRKRWSSWQPDSTTQSFRNRVSSQSLANRNRELAITRGLFHSFSSLGIAKGSASKVLPISIHTVYCIVYILVSVKNAFFFLNSRIEKWRSDWARVVKWKKVWRYIRFRFFFASVFNGLEE